MCLQHGFYRLFLELRRSVNLTKCGKLRRRSREALPYHVLPFLPRWRGKAAIRSKRYTLRLRNILYMHRCQLNIWQRCLDWTQVSMLMKPLSGVNKYRAGFPAKNTRSREKPPRIGRARIPARMSAALHIESLLTSVDRDRIRLCFEIQEESFCNNVAITMEYTTGCSMCQRLSDDRDKLGDENVSERC